MSVCWKSRLRNQCSFHTEGWLVVIGQNSGTPGLADAWKKGRRKCFAKKELQISGINNVANNNECRESLTQSNSLLSIHRCEVRIGDVECHGKLAGRRGVVERKRGATI